VVPCVRSMVFVRPFQLSCVFDFRPRFHHHMHPHGPCWTAPSVIQTNLRHSNWLYIDNIGLIDLFLWPRAVALGSETLSDADRTHVVQRADWTSLAENKDTITRIRGVDPEISYMVCI
jgi:hypothetical protein